MVLIGLSDVQSTEGIHGARSREFSAARLPHDICNKGVSERAAHDRYHLDPAQIGSRLQATSVPHHVAWKSFSILQSCAVISLCSPLNSQLKTKLISIEIPALFFQSITFLHHINKNRNGSPTRHFDKHFSGRQCVIFLLFFSPQ